MYLLLLVSVNTIILTGHELNKDGPLVWQVISLIAYGFGLMYWIIFTVWFSLKIGSNIQKCK